MFAPFFCHWSLSGAVPAATTVNVAVCPAVTVWLTGCVVIVGATAAAFTVSVVVLTVAVLALVRTITSNLAPLSAIFLASVVYFADRASEVHTPVLQPR